MPFLSTRFIRLDLACLQTVFLSGVKVTFHPSDGIYVPDWNGLLLASIRKVGSTVSSIELVGLHLGKLSAGFRKTLWASARWWWCLLELPPDYQAILNCNRGTIETVSQFKFWRFTLELFV